VGGFYKRECQEKVFPHRRRGESVLDIQPLAPGSVSPLRGSVLFLTLTPGWAPGAALWSRLIGAQSVHTIRTS
jgi:hypothetical protein